MGFLCQKTLLVLQGRDGVGLWTKSKNIGEDEEDKIWKQVSRGGMRQVTFSPSPFVTLFRLLWLKSKARRTLFVLSKMVSTPTCGSRKAQLHLSTPCLFPQLSRASNVLQTWGAYVLQPSGVWFESRQSLSDIEYYPSRTVCLIHSPARLSNAQPVSETRPPHPNTDRPLSPVFALTNMRDGCGYRRKRHLLC